MQTLATRLIPGVSIALLHDGDGWRFGSWSSPASIDGRVLDPPPTAAQALRFATADAAVAFFRTIAPRRPAQSA